MRVLFEEYQYRLFNLPVNICVRGMPSSSFGDDSNGRELHMLDVHFGVLIKERLYLTLQILIGGECAGILSYPDGLEIFGRVLIWTFTTLYAMLISSSQEGYPGMHTSSLPLLAERAGGEARYDRHGATALSLPKPGRFSSVLPPRSGLPKVLTRDQATSDRDAPPWSWRPRYGARIED